MFHVGKITGRPTTMHKLQTSLVITQQNIYVKQDTCSNEHKVCPMPLWEVGLS